MAKAKRTMAPGSEKLKNPKEELFCLLYTSNSSKTFFGNGQNCYVMAYAHQDWLDEIRVEKATSNGKTWDALHGEEKKILETARTCATRLFTKVHIQLRCNWLMDQFLSNEVIDRELAWTAIQRGDLRSKVQAIAEYNKVRDRISEKVQGTVRFVWEDDEADASPPPVKNKKK